MMCSIYGLLCVMLVLLGVRSEEAESGDCGCSAKLSRDQVTSTAAIEVPLDQVSDGIEVEELGGRILSTDASGPMIDMVFIEGGDTFIGTNKPILIADGEGPIRTLTLSPYWIDRYSVTNEGKTHMKLIFFAMRLLLNSVVVLCLLCRVSEVRGSDWIRDRK